MAILIQTGALERGNVMFSVRFWYHQAIYSNFYYEKFVLFRC